ncbi:MAG: hypothetical protein WC531_01230 [Candidatus Paceibacterota bacterium]|jgi:hypothetical protein
MDNKKEFPGVLKDISPRLLIDEKNKKEIQSFFLILGLIFNDLKGLVFFQKLIEDNYRKPREDEVSVHTGEYNGLIAQADKLLIATVGEFFKFIEKNKSVINSLPFLLLIKNLDSNIRNKWNDLIILDQGSTILSKIARVRSNVAFHYDNSMEELRRGFIDSFFSKKKDLAQHVRAYYAFGDDMEHTRLYYSDAAAQDYVNSLIGVEDRVKITESIEDMNKTIQSLLKAYMESLKH